MFKIGKKKLESLKYFENFWSSKVFLLKIIFPSHLLPHYCILTVSVTAALLLLSSLPNFTPSNSSSRKLLEYCYTSIETYVQLFPKCQQQNSKNFLYCENVRIPKKFTIFRWNKRKKISTEASINFKRALFFPLA